MSGVRFGSASANAGVYTFAQQNVAIANFGSPAAPLIETTIPVQAGGRFIVDGVLFFNLGLGGMDFSLATNTFFQGQFEVNSVAGGATGQLVGTFPPLFIPCPGATFNNDTVVTFVMRHTNYTPLSDMLIRFTAVENTAVVPGILAPGSYIRVTFF